MKKLNLIIFLCITFSLNVKAQILIQAEEGYTPEIGTLVSMLNDLSNRVERTVGDMSISEIDFLLDENANSIGTLVMHLAACEKLYQLMTFENKEYFENREGEMAIAMSMGKVAQEKFKNKDIKEYLKVYKDVREKTLEYLKEKDDSWLKEINKELNMNYHWAWFHVMEHQSSHLGQILFLKKRLPNEE